MTPGLTGAFCQHFRLDDNASVERNLLGDLGRPVGQVVHGQWIESLNKQHSCEDSVSDVVREIGKDNLLLSSLFIGSGVSAYLSMQQRSMSQPFPGSDFTLHRVSVDLTKTALK